MKTVLITGASSGIGEATAKRLLDDGHRIYVAARRVERMRGLEELGARPLKMDITEEADVRGVVDRIESESGGIDVVVIQPGIIRTEFGDVVVDAVVERSGGSAYAGWPSGWRRLRGRPTLRATARPRRWSPTRSRGRCTPRGPELAMPSAGWLGC